MFRSIASGLMMLAMTSIASAATIVSYNLQGTTGDQAFQAPFVQAANTTGVNLTRGAGLVASAAGNSFSASGFESAVQAPSSNEFFEFGFNVAPGYKVDVSELYVGTRSSNTGPGTIGLYSSVDNFTTPISTWGVIPAASFVNQVVNLSSLPDLTGNVRFRFYEVGNAQANNNALATASTGTFRVTAYFASGVFDRDFQITGTVNAVPEASSIFMVMIVMTVGVVAVRARRRVASV
jgi:hypothetical protein